jgi:hypothetical protein
MAAAAYDVERIIYGDPRFRRDRRWSRHAVSRCRHVGVCPPITQPQERQVTTQVSQVGRCSLTPGLNPGGPRLVSALKCGL